MSFHTSNSCVGSDIILRGNFPFLISFVCAELNNE